MTDTTTPNPVQPCDPGTPTRLVLGKEPISTLCVIGHRDNLEAHGVLSAPTALAETEWRARVDAARYRWDEINDDKGEPATARESEVFDDFITFILLKEPAWIFKRAANAYYD